MSRAVFWGLVAATLGVSGVMVGWSLPRITAEAGGLRPFDVRPAGYSEAEARAFLGALTDAGRDFYARVQHRLDIACPALLALTLVLAFRRLTPPGAVRAGLSAVAVLAMTADWAENALVARMLALPAADVPAGLIAWASRATLAKGALAAVALTGLLVLLLSRLRRRV